MKNSKCRNCCRFSKSIPERTTGTRISLLEMKLTDWFLHAAISDLPCTMKHENQLNTARWTQINLEFLAQFIKVRLSTGLYNLLNHSNRLSSLPGNVVVTRFLLNPRSNEQLQGRKTEVDEDFWVQKIASLFSKYTWDDLRNNLQSLKNETAIAACCDYLCPRGMIHYFTAKPLYS